jgi:hypothetical protein
MTYGLCVKMLNFSSEEFIDTISTNAAAAASGMFMGIGRTCHLADDEEWGASRDPVVCGGEGGGVNRKIHPCCEMRMPVRAHSKRNRSNLTSSKDHLACQHSSNGSNLHKRRCGSADAQTTSSRGGAAA